MSLHVWLYDGLMAKPDRVIGSVCRWKCDRCGWHSLQDHKPDPALLCPSWDASYLDCDGVIIDRVMTS